MFDPNNCECSVSKVKKKMRFFEHPETKTPVTDISTRRDLTLPMIGILKASKIQDQESNSSTITDGPLFGLAPEGCYFL